MIRLHPLPEPFHSCPYCGILLQVNDWYMPGMRIVADLHCSQCGRNYYGDLLAGHALHSPMLLEQATGYVHNAYPTSWFAGWLRDSYRHRTVEPRTLTVEEFRPLHKVLVVNCLDVQYGHLLSKLFNTQYYLDHHPDYDLVVIVPKYLRWLVPDGVAAIWTIDIGLRSGIEWNDWLAMEFRRRLASFDEVMLSVGYSHPHATDFAIERFSRVSPFDMASWQAAPERPVIAFIWREDRRWEGSGSRQVVGRLQGIIYERLPRRITLGRQCAKVAQLAEQVRRYYPTVRFVVVGFGIPTGLPEWIDDLRTTQIDDETERAWCELYAQSHVVIGVHGSNMLLPSAHAATTVNLLPEDRLGNVVQDLFPREEDARMALIRYRLVPLSTSVRTVAAWVASIIRNFHTFRLHFERENLTHRAENFPKIALLRRNKRVKRSQPYW